MKIGALIRVSCIELGKNILKEVQISKLYAILQNFLKNIPLNPKYEKSVLFQRVNKFYNSKNTFIAKRFKEQGQLKKFTVLYMNFPARKVQGWILDICG